MMAWILVHEPQWHLTWPGLPACQADPQQDVTGPGGALPRSELSPRPRRTGERAASGGRGPGSGGTECRAQPAFPGRGRRAAGLGKLRLGA